eukprot:scaffold103475_cov67-Attheya_sp.AAC.3
MEKLVRYILKKFGLYELAQKEAVEIKITYDGAQLTGNKGHIALGIQPADARATDPKMPGKVLYLDEGRQVRSFQSRNNVVITRIHMMGETEENVDQCFGDVYKFAREPGINGLPGAKDGEPYIFPIRWVGCHDKSATQKVQKVGSGCCNKVLFCNMCECTKHELYTVDEGNLVCDKCKKRGRNKCMHWSVNYEEEIGKKQVTLALMLEESEDRKRCSIMDDSDNEGNQPAELPPVLDFTDLIESEVLHQEEELERKSNIMCSKASAPSEINPMHVDFQSSGNESTNKFNMMLLEELKIRDMLCDHRRRQWRTCERD